MHQVVLDTNVWVSAFLSPGGTCEQLLQQLVNHRVEVIVSPALVDELKGVLHKKMGASDAKLKEVLALVGSMSLMVVPRERVNVVTDDESDNRVLECALEARADLIVTGDAKHLLPLRTFRGIPIQSPRAVLDRLG